MNYGRWFRPATIRAAFLVAGIVFVAMLLFGWLVEPLFPSLGEFPARVVVAGFIAGLAAWLVHLGEKSS